MAAGTPIRTPMALVALAALIAFALLAAMLADSTVHFSVRSGQPSRLQLFHADAKRFAEAHSPSVGYVQLRPLTADGSRRAWPWPRSTTFGRP